MRKVLIACAAFVGFCSSSIAFAAAPTNVLGRILLQTEQRGEAWYVDPVSEQRVYVRNGSSAFAAMRTFGLGITNSDIGFIPVGVSDTSAGTDTDADGLSDDMEFALGSSAILADSDSDGFSDFIEVTAGFDPNGPSDIGARQDLVDRLKGRILLQIESRGEAWYVSPVDGKRYYMNNGDAAFSLMQHQSLGIADTDLGTIPVYDGLVDCGTSIDCLIGAVQTQSSATASDDVASGYSTIRITATIAVSSTAGISTIDITSLTQPTDASYGVSTTNHMSCTYTDILAMTAVLERWAQDSSEADDLAFATCIIDK